MYSCEDRTPFLGHPSVHNAASVPVKNVLQCPFSQYGGCLTKCQHLWASLGTDINQSHNLSFQMPKKDSQMNNANYLTGSNVEAAKVHIKLFQEHV